MVEGILGEAFKAVWFILPAYVANSIAIDVSGIPFLKKYSTPVDFGLRWKGTRLLGDGKTWRGVICGVAGGITCGLLQMAYQNNTDLPGMTLTLAFLLGLGALVGDMTASFIKRRFSFERGASIPLVDQLDYIFGAFFFAGLAVPINVEYFVIVAVITVPAHLIANFVAYKIKLKDVPW